MIITCFFPTKFVFLKFIVQFNQVGMKTPIFCTALVKNIKDQVIYTLTYERVINSGGFRTRIWVMESEIKLGFFIPPKSKNCKVCSLETAINMHYSH